MLLGSSGRQLNPCCLGRQGGSVLEHQGSFLSTKKRGPKICCEVNDAFDDRPTRPFKCVVDVDANASEADRRNFSRRSSFQRSVVERQASFSFASEMTQSWIKVLLVTIFLIKTSAAWKGRSLECWQCAAIPGSRSFFIVSARAGIRTHDTNKSVKVFKSQEPTSLW